MTVMVCHVKTWNKFYELIDTLDVRMWRNFWISMFCFIFRAFWIENTQIDFSIFRRFCKVANTEILELTLDTLQVPAGTCRLVIWSWISLMMNTWTIRLLISQYQGSGCQISCRTSTWRMICGAVPRTLTGARLDTQYWMFGSLIVNVSKEIYRELLSQLYCNVFYYIVMYRNVL